MTTAHAGIVTNLYRKGHAAIHPGNPATPVVHCTALEASLARLTVEERARLSLLPATFDAEPPPLCVHTLDAANHELHVAGLTHGKVEPIVHDHFTNYKPDGFADTFWTVTQWGPQTGAGAVAGIVQTATDGHGVIVMAARGAAGATLEFGKFARAIAPLAQGALWVRSRVYFPAAYGLTNRSVLVGLIDAWSPTQGAVFNYNPAASSTWLGLTGPPIWGVVTIPGVVTTDTWYDLDLLLDGTQQFAAFWVNGDGPYTLTTNLPTGSITPHISITTTPAASPQAFMYVDNYFLDVVRGADIRHPTYDPALTAKSLV
jgi:hypothetical protein